MGGGGLEPPSSSPQPESPKSRNAKVTRLVTRRLDLFQGGRGFALFYPTGEGSARSVATCSTSRSLSSFACSGRRLDQPARNSEKTRRTFRRRTGLCERKSM